MTTPANNTGLIIYSVLSKKEKEETSKFKITAAHTNPVKVGGPTVYSQKELDKLVEDATSRGLVVGAYVCRTDYQRSHIFQITEIITELRHAETMGQKYKFICLSGLKYSKYSIDDVMLCHVHDGDLETFLP